LPYKLKVEVGKVFEFFENFEDFESFWISGILSFLEKSRFLVGCLISPLHVIPFSFS
jgi:hypothetical protein